MDLILPAFDGTAGDDMIAALRADMFTNDLPNGLTNSSFRAFLEADIRRFSAYGSLYLDLPNNLRHFAKDFDHLKFFTNTDVRKSLTWIKNNRSNLFTDYPNLTPGEITALCYYSTDNGYQINFWLRNLPVRPGIEWTASHASNYIKMLDDAFSKLPNFNSSTPLLRLEGRALSDIASLSIGQRLDYQNFISTAKNNQSSFLNGFKNANDNTLENIIFEVSNPNGVKTVDLEPFAQLNIEREALATRGKGLEISDIQYKRFPVPEPEELVSPYITLEDAQIIVREELDAWATSLANPNRIEPSQLIPGSPEYENAILIRTLIVNIVD